MSESNSPDVKPIKPPVFGDIEEKGPKSGVSDRTGGRIDRKPYSTRGAEQARTDSSDRRTQDSFDDSFTPKIEVSDLLVPLSSNENPPRSNSSDLGPIIPVIKGVYIYTRDPENPNKLILAGINNKFVNAKSVIPLEDPYTQEALEVKSIFYNKDQSIKGSVRYIVLTDGKGGLKRSSE